MLTYSLISNRPDLTRLIYDSEAQAPEWFRSSGAVWHSDFAAFEAFWKSAWRVFGLFSGDDLLAAVYIEKITATEVNVHVSVIAKVPEAELVRFFQSLIRQHVMEEGITVITGWMTSTNRGLRRIGEAAGFRATGLTMRYGQMRNKPIKWIQMRA